MTSITSIKQEAENLPDFHSEAVKRLELKEKVIFLAHLLAQMKIAHVTNDDEKLLHMTNKFMCGDVCNLEKIKSDIAKAKKLHKGNTITRYEQCIKKIEKEFTLFVKEAAINI